MRELGDHRTAENYIMKGFVVCMRWVGHVESNEERSSTLEGFGTND
jgi:hypothetical protein